MKMSSMDQGLTLQQRTDRLLGRVAGGRYTPLVPKESISEPPKKEVEMAKGDDEHGHDEVAKVPDFDSDRVEQLLSILQDLGGSAEYPSIKASAVMQLRAIDKELWRELYPDQAEAEDKRFEEMQKQEEESRKRREEEKAA